MILFAMMVVSRGYLGDCEETNQNKSEYMLANFLAQPQKTINNPVRNSDF